MLDGPTAQILASVSDAPQNRFLDLTRASRSTGSSLKPFIYQLAFSRQIVSPASLVDDSPRRWAGYAPGNFDDSYTGRLPAGEALALSRNVPAVELLWRVGVPDTIEMLHRLGMKGVQNQKEQTPSLTLAVGGAEATLVELAQAYATLSRGGVHANASLVGAPNAPKHEETHWMGLSFLPFGSPGGSESEPVLDPTACEQVLAALRRPAVTASMSSRAARLGAAWKTGTSSQGRDAVCIATTRSRTVAVWIGDVSGSPSPWMIAAQVAAPLALDILAATDPSEESFEAFVGPAPRQTSDERSWANAVTGPTETRTNRSFERRSTTPPASGSMEQAQPDRTLALGTLEITSPAASQVLLIDPSLPLDRQKVRLQAARASVPAEVRWFVDNAPIDAAPTTSSWWTPRPGTVRLRAVAADGSAATLTVHVHEARPE
ncbi:MAG: penicillin-binding transpeptidase domain-containing protein [Tepidisphaeraceae bacterium]